MYSNNDDFDIRSVIDRIDRVLIANRRMLRMDVT